MVYIKNQLHSVKRVDIVWDQYFPDSLKKKKRNDHGRCVHRQVKPNGYLPYDWSTFLRYSELFECLSKKLKKDIDLDKCSVVTVNDTIFKKSANKSHWFGAMEN